MRSLKKSMKPQPGGLPVSGPTHPAVSSPKKKTFFRYPFMKEDYKRIGNRKIENLF